ncbi:hypothetical protein PAAG_05986 [Paracoccidioides lutzii Pb01]|uniref:Glyoxalase-like domain-containing protein n=1 Tax=Paracoccidioides lutzii (strain ATCC MYA-826 / Pb01) TaxID=502779 RepID=C1H5E5_PARBA|nr:hypothetical protein PAAG_05986 [Paracoccidioides lutzii Pb01]EEH34939.2 hypothetical protein PAAG_05986 [Paracoccidioides lutzii Pb01]
MSSPATSAPTRLRQIALVSLNLKRAEHLLTKVIGTEVVFVDPGVEKWGLENILVGIGGDFIEVVSPTKPNTTAGRLLSKRGDGGYMIIMQTVDARQQRAHIESRDLGKVIYMHEHEDSVCIQYHPKGIRGGVIPELDSYEATPANPTPVTSRFSPWHACGKNYSSYSKGMNNTADLYLTGVTCRLAPGDKDIDAALDQWKATFGIAGNRDYLQFTNVSMRFLPGMEGQSAGLMDITIAVQGEERLKEIFDRARELNVPSGDGWVDMLGVRWRFVKKEDGSKL